MWWKESLCLNFEFLGFGGKLRNISCCKFLGKADVKKFSSVFLSFLFWVNYFGIFHTEDELI